MNFDLCVSRMQCEAWGDKSTEHPDPVRATEPDAISAVIKEFTTRDVKKVFDEPDSVFSYAHSITVDFAAMASTIHTLRARLAEAERVTHSSDCAVHNAPAMLAGPCDCWANELARLRAENNELRARVAGMESKRTLFFVVGRQSGAVRFQTLSEGEARTLARGADRREAQDAPHRVYHGVLLPDEDTALTAASGGSV